MTELTHSRWSGAACGRSCGPGPGASSTTWTSWAPTPSTTPGSRSSRCPWPTPDDLARAGRFLLDRGIYVTLAFYPGVPREEVGFRIQLTAANTDEQINLLNDVLAELCDRFSIHAQSPQSAVGG